VSATADQVPPQNLDAEKATIGSMLVLETAQDAVLEEIGLKASDFYLDRHQILHGCIAHLRSEGRVVDELMVLEELGHHGRLKDAGGRPYISELAATVPAAGNARHYAEIVQRASRMRQLLGVGQEIQTSVHNRNGTDSAELHRCAAKLLADVAPVDRSKEDWLGSAADLLSRPDPGPTPFIVEELLVEKAIAALVGSQKRGKTWLLIDLGLAIATGQPMFGSLEVKQGPVLLILEESGEDALHRRLGMLCRARGLVAADLVDFHYAANRRVRLDDPTWQGRLLATVERLDSPQVFLDPLVRMKGNADENSQAEMGPVLDFIRDLREVGGGGVLFAHHTGHGDKGRMRGTSDFEGYWESKLVLTAEEGSAIAELRPDHREAGKTQPFTYRRVLDEQADSLRLERVSTPARTDQLEELLSAVGFEPGRSTNELAKAVAKRRQDTASRLLQLEQTGMAHRRPSQITDGAGRTRTIDGWFPASQSGSQDVPDSRTAQDALPTDSQSIRPVPPLEGGTGDGEPPGTGTEGAAT
jgi:hypothetical protein